MVLLNVGVGAMQLTREHRVTPISRGHRGSMGGSQPHARETGRRLDVPVLPTDRGGIG